MNKQTNKQTHVCSWKDERKNIFNCIDGPGHVLIKLVVVLLLEVLPILYGTGSFITLSTWVCHQTLIWASSVLSITSHTCVMKICLNIVHFIPVSPKCLLFISFSGHTFVCISHVLLVCCMSLPYFPLYDITAVHCCHFVAAAAAAADSMPTTSPHFPCCGLCSRELQNLLQRWADCGRKGVRSLSQNNGI